MARSVTSATMATLGAAAFALTLGASDASAESVKITSSKSHGYGHSGYRGHSGGHSGGHGSGHSNGHHDDRPSYRGHHGPYWHGSHGGHGHGSYGGHGYRGPYYAPRVYGYGGHATHKGYYCSHCHYRTTSYSIFYNHVYHHHHVPWYDIAGLIVFDPVTLIFSFGGHH